MSEDRFVHVNLSFPKTTSPNTRLEPCTPPHHSNVLSMGENLDTRGEVDAQRNKDMLVYSRRSKSKCVEKFTLDALRESKRVMNPSNLESSFYPGTSESPTNDLPVVLKK